MWISFLKPKSYIAKPLIIIIVLTFFALGYLGHLKTIKDFLDSEKLSFVFNDTRFSAFILVKFTLIIVLFFWVTGIVSEFGEKRIKQITKIKASNRSLIIKAYQVTIYIFALFIVLDKLDLDLTGLAVFSGAIGIGIGIGFQKIASNFISGLILLFEKTVVEGDLIELDEKTIGFVKFTGARHTLIETFDGRDVMVPNEDFITNKVTNWTHSNTKGRIEINIGVAYGTDLKLVHDLMLNAALEHPKCSKITPAECFLVEYGDSSIVFTLFFWVDNVIDGRKRPKSDVLFEIWDKFKQNNITIPFPQRDLHVKNTEVIK